MQNSLARGDLHPISPRAYLYLLLILVFWTAFSQFSKPNLDTFPDLLENYVWGIRWQWGNSNHPPLFGWAVAAWFELFPRNDLSYRVFASLNLTVSLYIMLFIARRFLTPLQQDAALVVAFALPLLGFQAVRYNANAAMLPFWALIILLYLRLWERPRIIDAGLIGLFAACAILSKYFSATLLIVLFLHTLFVAKQRETFFSRYGLLASTIFVMVLTPHIIWLFENDFRPMVFAASEQGSNSLGPLIYSQADFFLGQFVYLMPGLLFLGLLRSPAEGKDLFDFSHIASFYKMPQADFLLIVFFGPVLVAMVLSLMIQSPLTSNWSLPIHIVSPIILISLLPKKQLQLRSKWVPAIAVLFCSILLALSPTLYQRELSHIRHYSALPVQMISQVAEDNWNREVGKPLNAVYGDGLLGLGAAFYTSAKPQVVTNYDFSTQPWVDEELFQEEALLILCQKPTCVEQWEKAGWNTRALTDAIVPAFEGAGGPSEYRIHLWAARSGE